MLIVCAAMFIASCTPFSFVVSTFGNYPASESLNQCYALPMLGSIILSTLVGLASNGGANTNRFLGNLVLFGGFILYFLGSILFVIIMILGLPADVGYLAGVLTGVGYLPVGYIWYRKLIEVDTVALIPCSSAALGIAGALLFLMSCVPLGAQYILFAVFLTGGLYLPFSELLSDDAAFGHAPKSVGFRQVMDKMGKVGGLVIVPGLALLLFAFMTGVRKQALVGTFDNEMFGAISAALIAFFCALYFRKGPFAPFTIRVVVPISIGILAVFDAFPDGSMPLYWGGMLLYTFIFFVAVVSIPTLMEMVRAESLPAAIPLCLITGSMCIASLGGICFHLLSPVPDYGPYLRGASAIFFAIILAVLTTESWKTYASRTLNDVADGPDGVFSKRKLDFEERCLLIAQTKRLSKRESQVLVLLGRGHSVVYISDSLFIAESTARTHIGNIYRKLGIRSRDNLLTLIDAVGEDGE